LEYGDLGSTEMEKSAVSWEICKVDVGTNAFIGLHQLGMATVIACREEE
jgi:hypothetical protein